MTEDNEKEEKDTASTSISDQCKPSKLVDISAYQSDSTKSALTAVSSAATSVDEVRQTDNSSVNQIPAIDSSSSIKPINKSLLPSFSPAVSQKKPIPVNDDKTKMAHSVISSNSSSVDVFERDGAGVSVNKTINKSLAQVAKKARV